MDLSNSFISSAYKSPVLTPVERQSRLPVPVQPSGDESRQGKRSQNNNELVPVNQVDFIKRGESIQSDRYQRYNALENASPKGQQALNSYQQTIDAAKQYEEGELVGIDLYV